MTVIAVIEDAEVTYRILSHLIPPEPAGSRGRLSAFVLGYSALIIGLTALIQQRGIYARLYEPQFNGRNA